MVGGVRALVMELVEGPTLGEILKEKELLPAPAVVEIGIQLARALDYGATLLLLFRYSASLYSNCVDGM